jgi:hypothetical protein
VPVPELKPHPDLILCAIEEHRRAWAALSAECSPLDEQDTPEAKLRLDELNDAVSEAEARLVEIEPTTRAGAIELSRCVSQHEARGDFWADHEPLHRNLASAIERLA